MINLKFEKLYKDDRIKEPCMAAIPFARGVLNTCENIVVSKEGIFAPVQSKITSKWGDGSVKWALVRFLADLNGNKSTDYILDINGIVKKSEDFMATKDDNGITVDTGALRFSLTTGNNVFDKIIYKNTNYSKDQFTGPVLEDGNGNIFDLNIENWNIVENGTVCAIVRGQGYHFHANGTKISCTLTLTAYADKPWIELAYRIINTTYEPLHIADLNFHFHENSNSGQVRTCVADSSYATHYTTSESGETVEKIIDAEKLLYSGNEHYGEVFYGTLFADHTSEKGGLCATVYQAHQNFPKAVKAHKDGLCISLVPKNVDKVVMQSGMAREQKILLHFHDTNTELYELNNRSTIYQMPDRPMILPEVYKNAGVFEDVFLDKTINDVEIKFTLKLDNHSRCYGMLNWGDSPDPGYSQQGRGNGASVWTNNEYDFSHACTLMYVRTGKRRFLDYMFVSSRHWMDVDVCHFSDDPLTYQGQWEHARGHCIGSHMACSHEWVAGLLDYYHFTGDEIILATAIGIGENVMRILNSPEFSNYGALHARETGWALRTMVDLYNETNDKKWLEKCDWIVGHFETWEKKYGCFLAPYTDNTEVRVVFMIAVAVNSLMRYYRVNPSEKIKNMIIRAVDDLLENCLVDNGLFYYKELPSLQKPSNSNILETLTIAFELTGDKKYLEAGIGTFKLFMNKPNPVTDLTKKIEGDSVINAGEGTKDFAQSFWPVMTYYKTSVESGNVLFNIM